MLTYFPLIVGKCDFLAPDCLPLCQYAMRLKINFKISTEHQILMSTDCVWVAYKGWKKEIFKFKISILSKNCMTMFRFDSWGLRGFPATGIRFSEREEPRPAFGEVVRVLHHCAQALLEQHCSRSKRTTPYTGKQVQHRIRWISNSKCKLVIIEYPGPTSEQPWPMDFKKQEL